MNTVTIFILLSSIIPKIGTSASFITAIGLAASVTLIGCALASKADEDFTKRFGGTPIYPVILQQFKWIVPALITSAFIATITPDRQTLYMIAASELGEEVIKSPEALELYEEVKSVLRSYSKSGSND